MKKNQTPAGTPENELPQEAVFAEETISEETAAAATDEPDAVLTEETDASSACADVPSGDTDELESILGQDAGEAASKKSDELDAILADNTEAEDDTTAKKEKRKKDRRKLRFGSMAVVLTAVVTAAVVLLNVVVGILNDRFPFKLDLNKDSTFSLTEESIKVAESINKDIEILIFYPQSTLEATQSSQEMTTILRQFTEGLKEYRSRSGNKLTYKYIDLVSNPTLAEQYTKYEITTGSILFRSGSGDTERYRALTLDNLMEQDTSNYYTTGEVTYTSKVESALATGINAVNNDNLLVTTVFTNHSENSNTISTVQDLLGLNGYTFEELNLASANKFNENSTLALIAAPTKDYTTDEITRLREWLNNDGKRDHHLMVFTDATADCPNLYSFLKTEFGITVTDNTVQETDTNRLYNGYGASVFRADAASGEFTADVTGTSNVTMMYPRQLLLGFKDDEQSSQRNTAVITSPDTSRLVKIQRAETTQTAEGVKADSYPVVTMAYAHILHYDNSDAAMEENNNVSRQRDTYVMVCGSPYFAGVSSQSSNDKTLLAVVNGMTGNSNVATVAGRSIEKESVNFSQTAANIMHIVFVYALPLVLLVICLLVFLKRRHL